MVPVVEELRSIPSPADALRAFAGADGLVLFDSALHRGRLGRYSFLTANPLISFEIQQATFGSDPFTRVRDTISQLNQSFELQRLPDLPPFQGGVAGTLSYELGGCWERAPRVGEDEFQLPDAWFGVYDWVLAWDHDQDRAWIVSHGLPVIGPHVTGQPGVTISAASDSDYEACQARAAHRVRDVLAMLDSADQNSPPPCDAGPTTCDRGPMTGNDRSIAAVDPSRLNPLPGWDGVSSDFTRDEYLTAVARVIEYIHAGDIFQANLSQRLLARCELPPVELYRTLRTCNPAPFAGFLAHDDWAIVSASPERFLRVEDGVVEARPIKGTRQRRVGPEADLFSRDELRQSEKDVAENVMIVDLLRNDLSRVCTPGSISVPELCVVESYETVQHLVSEVRGTLKSSDASESVKRDIWSLLAATFPGGSITGAPKVRAMEIIAEVEPTVRGPYCGSLFYSGFDGTFDSSILIRSFVCRKGWVQCRVGGGIVAQSDPVAEYEETLHKAEGMLRALQHAGLCQAVTE